MHTHSTKSKALVRGSDGLRKRGRKTVLDEELIAGFEKLFSGAVGVRVACDYLGVPTARFYEWFNRGKTISESENDYYQEDEVYIDLYNRCRRAQATPTVHATARLAHAAGHDWHAALEWLKAKDPRGYNRKVVEVGLDPFSLIERIPDPVLRMQLLDELERALDDEQVAGTGAVVTRTEGPAKEPVIIEGESRRVGE